jgi:hypothetical protein
MAGNKVTRLLRSQSVPDSNRTYIVTQSTQDNCLVWRAHEAFSRTVAELLHVILVASFMFTLALVLLPILASWFVR